MAAGRHLVLTPFFLRAGTERLFKGKGWGLFRIESGICYWREPDRVCELLAGYVLAFSDTNSGSLLASRLGPVEGHFTFVDSQLLSGLFSAGECKRLRAAQKESTANLRCFEPDHEVGRRFAGVVGLLETQSPEARLRLLDVFVTAFSPEFRDEACCVQPVTDAGDRLRQLVRNMAEADLTRLSVPQIAAELRCSQRHASRLFRASFGQSLRSKRTELRLASAKRLLETTDSKVIEVAMESGFHSLGLFNSMFKRAFGMTPSRWRRRVIQK